MNMLRRNSLILALLAGGLLATVGCSPGESSKMSEEEQRGALVQRVTERWLAMEAKDFGAVYEFNTQNYRDVFDKTLYLNKFAPGVDWELTGVDVVNYDADAAVASVAVRVMSESAKQTASVSVFGAMPSTVQENWILIDGQWWHSVK